MIDLNGKWVLVTGGTGFLGKAVCRVLRERGAIPCPIGSDYDLRTISPHDMNKLIFACRVVIHLAAKCGGIGANMAAPAEFIRDNLLMGLNVLESCRKMGTKMVFVGSVCSYPENPPMPIQEADLWNGYPEPTNAPYGIAKRAIGEALMAYHRQYGLPGAYVIPANLYGPHDNFDPQTSHVIPAMIRKILEANGAPPTNDRWYGGLPVVDMWGTGTPTRDFLYVDDAAEAIVRAAERVDVPTPINVGTGREVSMRELAYDIADACQLVGHIRFGKLNKTDGQPRRVLNTNLARELLDFTPQVALEDGLRETVKWYKETLYAADKSREANPV